MSEMDLTYARQYGAWAAGYVEQGLESQAEKFAAVAAHMALEGRPDLRTAPPAYNPSVHEPPKVETFK